MNAKEDKHYPYGLTRMEMARCREAFAAMIETKGNQTEAATKLGITRPTMRELVKRYHITQDMIDEAREHWQWNSRVHVEWQLVPIFHRKGDLLCVPTSL